jgi:ubiquinone/menaquinone biosynthesis C-methylase UbiE
VQRLVYRPEQDAVLRALRAHGARRVLDVGCGTGLLAARLRRELPRVRVVGCDFSHGMLAHAARRSDPAALVQATALALPFADARFDAVVSTEAFHWFPDPVRALREFRRVLAPGGRILVSLVNPPAEWMSRAARATSLLLRQPFDWPTRERMRERVEAAGLELVDQRFVLRFPLPFSLPTVLTEAVRPA